MCSAILVICNEIVMKSVCMKVAVNKVVRYSHNRKTVY